MNTTEAVPRSESFLSKGRLVRASLVALLGCAALCSLPLLAAIGVGGGVAAAVARFVRPGAEMVVGGVVFVAALAFMAVRLRSRRRSGPRAGCAGSCALPPAGLPSTGDSPLGGGATSTRGGRLLFRQGVSDGPIVCTANLTHAQAQIDGYRAAFTRLVGAERFAGGFRWRFRAELGLESQLRDLAEREAACCSFVSYDLTSDGQHIVWETTGDDRASSMLDEYFLLPERLTEEPRRGHDVAALKRSASRAGLAFTADANPVGDINT